MGLATRRSLELTPKLIDVIKVLEFVKIEGFVPSVKDSWTTYGVSFANGSRLVAKAVLDLRRRRP